MKGTLLLCLSAVAIIGANGFDRKHVIEVATHQYERLVGQLKLGNQYPSHGNPLSEHWAVSHDPKSHADWVAGFFPGSLWQLYHFTKNETWKQRAQTATHGLVGEQFDDGSHDVGFLVMCSYGEEYEVTKDHTIPQIIINAANHLASRFNHNVGCTRSWGKKTETHNFLVIVDNMMNLELLFKGAELSKNETLAHIAISHANKTAATHLRADHSSYHVVNFNQTDGSVIKKYTAQGYSDESCWSRGQAWLVTGFTKVYGFTKQAHFLEVAENVAKYFIAHLPEDGIPWWDFNAPHSDAHHTSIYVPRDVSAGAIASVGLFELYGHTHNKLYLDTAHKIIQSLGSTKYLANANPHYHLPALLANSTISKAHLHPDQADQSLPYADYYFLKGLSYLDKYPIAA